jgi:hypothetical protein
MTRFHRPWRRPRQRPRPAAWGLVHERRRAKRAGQPRDPVYNRGAERERLVEIKTRTNEIDSHGSGFPDAPLPPI